MDHRDRAREYGHDYDSFDAEKMTLVYLVENDDGEEYEAVLPAKFEVCPTCEGRGKHVNPGIDAHGLTQDDFNDDPEFAESYFSGRYDVVCYECKGNNVVPVIDEAHLNDAQKEDLKLVDRKLEDLANYYRECDAERRMGA